MNYSVLMSVYYREKPEYLRQSMYSILNQSVPTDDFVLVCDGPLTEELDAAIESIQKEYLDKLRVVRLEKNVGLGNALNAGIKFCKNDIVARMDSDDIARPDRCECQLAVFEQHPEIGMVSGIVEEFSNDPTVVDVRRIPPEKHEDILLFAKQRNPFNHPCIMYRKSAVEAAGGYQDFYLLEDYYLWIRMLQNGTKGYNLQIPLLWMRAGSDLYKRRAGLKYAKSQCKLFNLMRKSHFISLGSCMKSCIIRTCSACAPAQIRELLFKMMLRK